jgi:hypothetical protein
LAASRPKSVKHFAYTESVKAARTSAYATATHKLGVSCTAPDRGLRAISAASAEDSSRKRTAKTADAIRAMIGDLKTDWH